MRWADIPFRPSQRNLRQFAVLWIIFFGLAAAWHGLVLKHQLVAIILGVLALTVGPIGFAKPAWLRPIFVSWMVLVFPIGWVVSNIILVCVFFGLFAPLGLLFRLIGRDALKRKRQPDQSTYWTPKAMPSEQRRYFRQF